MDIRKTFEQGRFHDIVAMDEFLTSCEERMLLGMSYQNLGRDQQAMEIFQCLEREIHQRIKSLFYLARIYARQGGHAAAQEAIKKYLAFAPDDDEALDLLQEDGTQNLLQEASLPLAQIYAKQAHYRQALEIYVTLIEHHQDDAIRQEALAVQKQYLIQTLEGWLERLHSQGNRLQPDMRYDEKQGRTE